MTPPPAPRPPRAPAARRRAKPRPPKPRPRRERGPDGAPAPPPLPDAPATAQAAGLAAREAAALLLARVIDDRRSLSGLVDTRHGPPAFQALEPRDRALARAIVTTALRHRGQIHAALSAQLDRPPPKGARHLIHTLHVAAAQILFMQVPARAAVSLAVSAVRREPRSTRFARLANAVLRRVAETGLPASAPDAPAPNDPAPAPSVPAPGRAPGTAVNAPSWFAKRLAKQWGRERAAAILAQHARVPAIDLCCRAEAAAWADRLGGFPLFEGCVRVTRDDPVPQWPGYAEGAWWVQDAAAQLPAALLGDVAGVRVLDLCAAPGGKAAQLAAAGARVTAVELVADRATRLRSNMERLSLDVDVVEADLFDWTPEAPFEAILLDAPCSSTGTARRHPDVPWTKTSEDVAALAGLQRRMIERAATMLSPGGRLVFANCSIDRAEGEDILAAVLASGDLALDAISPDEVHGLRHLVNEHGWLRSLPCHLARPPAAGEDAIGAPDDPATGLDGFFAARLVRREATALTGAGTSR